MNFDFLTLNLVYFWPRICLDFLSKEMNKQKEYDLWLLPSRFNAST